MKTDVNFGKTLGVRLIEATPERAINELDFKPELQQLTGVFHAGVLMTMADGAATWAAIKALNPNGPVDGEPFPFTVQMSTNFLRNTNEGPIRCEAKVLHKGRQMVVVEATVRDKHGRTMMTARTTHLAVAK